MRLFLKRNKTKRLAGKVNLNLYESLNERSSAFEEIVGKVGLFLMRFLSLATIIILLFDLDQPKYYTCLFFLPLAFFVILIVFSGLFKNLFKNFGVLIITLLFFCRMVVSPLFMALGSYTVTITKNIETNTIYAILLMVYESFAVFGVLYYLNKQQVEIPEIWKENAPPTSKNKFTLLLLLVIYALLWCISYVPQVYSSLRTVLEIRNPTFTHYEDSYIVAEYGTTFIKKLAAVSGTYLIRILTIIVPAHLIVLLAKKKNIVRMIMGFMLCLFPLFFIGGAIARSLIYTLFLFFFTNYVFQVKNWKKKFIILVGCGCVAVVLYWILRTSDESIFTSFSKRFSAYFSGANVVSGVFNLPNEGWYKLNYFIKDFIGSIPYGGTIFHIRGDSIGTFFNNYNQSAGQIPTTIGMGYYYFGPIFAPIYSVLFACLVFFAGNALNKSHQQRPFRYIIYLYVLFYGSMGIVMYNIEITISNFFTVLLPILIMERITYGKMLSIKEGLPKLKAMWGKIIGNSK